MFLNSLDSKSIFTGRPDGIPVRDLTQTMLELNVNNYIAYSVYKVPIEFQMRPDLISKSVYNNTIYAELILKFNSISNPFSIKAGDILLIPDLNAAKTKIKKIAGENAAANRIRDSYKYIDPLKKPKKDVNLEDFNNRAISTPAGALPPNLAEEGTSQVTYRGGRVYFGEGAEQSCLKNGMNQSEFLTKVIKSKNK